ncbi:MAG: hypothetical protein JSS22_00930 [Proteobacteria bacterium]|nr:hypothetical protein [Pseudomonadota bacterium]
MTFKWAGPILLLAALVIGDQIRLNRPGHKYLMSVSVATPDGIKSASGVFAVVPYRGYSVSGATRTRGDALFVDLGHGKNLLALMMHGEKGAETDGMNYVALRAYRAAGRNVSFGNLSQMTGSVPVTGDLIPVLITFADLADPKTARVASPDDLAGVLGAGYRLNGITVTVVKNGFWPLDFGGSLGEPVTHGIGGKLPWWNGTDAPAAAALRAAGLVPTAAEARMPFDAMAAFIRK